VLAVTALKLSLVDHFNFSAFNFQPLATDQGLGNLAMRRFDNPAEGLARDIHPFGCILLIKTVQIR
jgi:hypothetical protein